MKAFFFCCLCLLGSVAGLPGVATAQDSPPTQEAPATEPPAATSEPPILLKPALPGEDVAARTIAGYKVEHPPLFFRAFFNHKSPPKRTAFETDEEYKERLKPKQDGRVYYFLVKRRIKSGEPHEESFAYNLKDKTLTIYGGLASDDTIKDQSRSSRFSAIPILFYSVGGEDGEYAATNGFGARLTVTRYAYTDYVFNIVNDKEFPSGVVDFRKHRVGLSLSAEREEAKTLSVDADVLIGIQLVDYNAGRVKRKYSEPTFNNPREFSQTIFGIDVKLTEILVIDSKSQKLLAGMTAAPPTKKK